jgi:hypothetical protein
LQGNYLLPWQNASLQNYPGPPGGSNPYPRDSNQYPSQYPGGSNPISGPADRRGNNNQPRLPSLPDPLEDVRYQDAGDIFRQFADQRDQQEGLAANNNDPNSNVPNSANNRNSNSGNSNATITVSGTTRRTTSRY